jgi:hypothetical protein
MAEHVPTPPPDDSTITVADVRALADRLQDAGTTSRRIDWPALQQDLLLAAKFLRALTRSREPAETVDARTLAASFERDGNSALRPDWDLTTEAMVDGALQLRALTADLQATAVVKIDD